LVPTRFRSFSSRLFAVAGGPSSVVCCFCPIGRRPIPISLCPYKKIVEIRTCVFLEIVQPGQFIATFGAAITKLGCSIAALRRF
jgi:hypothetical protein